MDTGIIITILAGNIAIVGVVISLFLWLRGEANADRRDIVNLIIEMKEESKSFNAKLYALEERYIIFMQNRSK